MNDIELVRAFQNSPLAWIEWAFSLVPQPLKAGISPEEDWEYYTPEHFEPFQKGKNLTWQQWLFFRAVERALAGKASRKIAIASGHGTGKSSAIALFLLWFLFCHKDAQCPCTAPTSQQMFDILWKEVALWHGRMPQKMRDLYEILDSYVRIRERYKTWFARAATGRKENPEALAGVHGEHVALIVDEASGVHEVIYETVRGALTNSNIFFVMISNPTRLSGFFFDAHHKNKRNWQTLRFDSRESPIVAPAYVEDMLNDYGEYSSQFAVRVLGEFPVSEEDQFIPTDLFDEAANRKADRDFNVSRVLGVDVAAFGGDACAYADRQGNDLQLAGERHGQDTMATVGDVMAGLRTARAEGNAYDFVTVDVIGIGRGVFDRLIELQNQGDIDKATTILAVNAAEKPYEDKKYANRRAELWDAYKQALKESSVDPQFKDDSCGIKYHYDSRGRLLMEKKEDMKERGLASPDRADAAVLTYAVASRPRSSVGSIGNPRRSSDSPHKNLPSWARRAGIR